MDPAVKARVEEVTAIILRDGFYTASDGVLGKRVEAMVEEGIPLASITGLRFCKEYALQNPQVALVLESLLGWFGFGLYRTIGPFPGPYTFGGNDPKSPATYLLVQFWKKNSAIKYWRTSHQHSLEVVKAENGLLRVIPASLHRLGLEPTTITLEDGGFTIIDGRVAFEIVKGASITCAFGTRSQIKDWIPMSLPRSPEMEQEVAKMKSDTYGINVRYVDLPRLI